MIRQIPVELPKSFEEALGCPGSLKWVAFYWEPCGDEAMYDDGVTSGDCNWEGYLAFMRHPRVGPWPFDYDFGSSDSEATHWLLCDLESREVYVGEKEEVKAFLVSEAKKVVPDISILEKKAGVSPEEFKVLASQIREALNRVPAPSMAEVEEKMRRDQEAVEKMVAELG